MGFIYKLKPEIKDFILEKKKEDSHLSCRQLAILVSEKFQINLSKSSVNTIIKQAALSMPVGRRRKKTRIRPAAATPASTPALVAPVPEVAPARPAPEIVKTAPAEPVPVEKKDIPPVIETRPGMLPGAIILKAADYLVKGSYYLSEVLKAKVGLNTPEVLAQTEALIYLPLFNNIIDDKLCSLLGGRVVQQDVYSYLNKLQQVKGARGEILRVIVSVFQEVRCLKFYLSDGSDFYLDGQMHTLWSTSQVPYSFSTTLYNSKGYINRLLQQDSPLILFTAPGYDVPTEEFFNFMLNWDSGGKDIQRLMLYSNKLTEIEVISMAQNKKRTFIFGMWPWQFSGYRRVKTNSEFRPFLFEPLKQNFYLAEVEIELLQPNLNQRVTLKGCALKNNPLDKVRVVILSNLLELGWSVEQVAGLYLSRWPNLEESFQDFSRKTELFTYTAASQAGLSTENLVRESEASGEGPALFKGYLEILDEYVRRRFLPSEYEKIDFASTKERFYNLSGELLRKGNAAVLTFRPPKEGYPFLKDLQYACRRLNEADIRLKPEERLWFNAE
jgi:hypothetical protein